jgi:PAS domain S-box-containing protein
MRTGESMAAEETLAGGGDMGRLMRAHDWSATPLGPVAGWPQSLKVALRILLGSRYPMFVWWGRQMTMFHNDAYAPILGKRHPGALGQSAPTVWSDIWEDIRPLIEPVWDGRACWQEERLLVMERNGYTEEAYFTFSYSPIPDDGGGVGGVFCACSEDTQRVVSQRRQRTLRELAEKTARSRTAGGACAAAADVLAGNRHDVPFALIYLLEDVARLQQGPLDGGGVARLAGATGLPAGSPGSPPAVWLTGEPPLTPAAGAPWRGPFAAVRQSGRAERVTGLGGLGPLLDPVWPEPPAQAAPGAEERAALVLPVGQPGQDRLAGFLVAGLSPRRAFDEDYRVFLEMVAGHVGAAVANARAYEEEKRRAEALAELDRAKTAFFSNVSHEFRTPLTLLLGPVEEVLAGAGGELPPAQRERLAVAHRNAQRLQKLVNTLLDFSRIEAGRMQASYQPTDLAALTAELASNFRSACERAGLRLVVDCPPLGQPVYVDRDMWEKVVLNLLSNAFKYTLEGRIEVALRRSGGQAVLTVRDTGVGIPAGHLPLLFERFHRVEGARGRTQEGTGIGLALVKELAHLHGGEVRAESEPGKGSTFTVAVPLGKAHLPADRLGAAPGAADQRPRAASPLASTALGAAPYVEEALRWLPRKEEGGRMRDETDGPPADSSFLLPPSSFPVRVLVADDNADMRDYIGRLLGGRWEVTAVSDGLRALRSAQEDPPDLVLSDVMMPGLDGFGLLKALRADPRTAAVPVLLLSARAGEEARVEGLQSGADDYLTKPFGARELLARVGAHLELARVRRQAGEERRRSDQQIRSILESITDAFFALDRSWRFTYVNQQAERLLGRRRDDLLGKLVWEEFAAAVGTDFDRQYHRALAENVTVTFEAFYPPHDRWYEVHAYPSPDGLAVYFRDANERRRAREAQRESEAKYRAVVESNMIGIGFWRSDGTITEANDTLLAMIGRTREEVEAGQVRFPEITPPEHRAADDRAMAEIAATGSCAPFEKEYLRKDGRRVPIVLGAACLPSDPGRGPFFALDISDRKQAEGALREASATLRSFYETSPLMMGVVEVQAGSDSDIVHLTDNAATGQFFGVDPAAIAGRRASALGVPPRQMGEWVRRYRERERTGQPVRFEYPHETAAGVRWVSATVYCIERLPGGRSRCSYVAEDVTERKRVEETLRRQSERLRLLWEAATVLLTTDDPDALLRGLFARIAPHFAFDTYFNFLVDEGGDGLRLASCAGIPEGEARKIGRLPFGQAVCGTVALRRRPVVATHIQSSDDPMVQLVKGFGVRSYACNPLLAEGRLLGTLSFASRSRDEFSPDELEFLETISQYVTVAYERLRLVRQLQEQDRRKDEFLATLAHELRNPLAPIRNSLQVLKMPRLDPAAAGRSLGMMERQVQHLVRLVDDLMDVSRVMRGKVTLHRERVDLAGLVARAVEAAQPLIEAQGHELTVAAAGEPLPVEADPVRLAQVVGNLLTNAAKYTEPGGRIWLTARREGGEAVLRVRDTGIGIAPEMLPRVFDLFVQADHTATRAQGGLGIGLTLVKNLVEMHHGAVQADSAGLGAGSEFVVRLPLVAGGPTGRPADREGEEGSVPSSAGRPVCRSAKRLLVVDDNVDAADSLALLLRLQGHEVRVANNGPAALELAAGFRPEAVILDLGMPGMDGCEVARRLRRMPGLGKVRLAALTGWGQPEDRRRTAEAGFDQHFVKPVEPSTLEELLAGL